MEIGSHLHILLITLVIALIIYILSKRKPEASITRTAEGGLGPKEGGPIPFPKGVLFFPFSMYTSQMEKGSLIRTDDVYKKKKMLIKNFR